MADLIKSMAWVLVQALLLVALVFAPKGPAVDPGDFTRLGGYGLVCFGLAVILFAALNLGTSLTPLPLPNPGSTLKQRGLYRFVRHPIYSGVMIAAAGVVVASGGLVTLLIFAALCVFFSAKSRYEERLLRLRFDDYDEYAARTPRFVPRARR